VHEYEFNLLPIAYTFGHGHKIKILISSSNWPRYQSNPNIPIEEGDFFRRSPEDNQTYNFQGTEYQARVAHQQVFFSPDQPSQLILPLFDGISDPSKTKDPDLNGNDWLIYPNPFQTEFAILTKYTENYSIKLYDVSGNIVYEQKDVNGKSIINGANLAAGVYVVKLETSLGIVYTQKLVKF
jgi:hypothetical protein